uniref:STAS domain-containing protein n=1 Tax=Lepeophtheirus salmonis TaxID=72036 RepID=A0A0K2VC85_LEPSM
MDVVDSHGKSSEEEYVVRIHRNALNYGDLQEKYGYIGQMPMKDHIKKLLNVECNSSCILRELEIRLPFTKWIRHYDWKKDFICDLVAGFTVCIMQIPQGMAYAILAGVQPIVGIYTAFFPALIYMLFGTSPHASLGTFAVISIIISSAVVNISTTEDCSNLEEGNYCPIQVATAVTFTTGCFQFIFGVFQIGKLTNFLSKPFVSGFTTGSAIHVFTSQVKYLFGLSIKRSSGYFTVIKTYIEIFKNIADSNFAVIGISIVSIFILAFYDNLIKERLKKFCRFPFPIQLMLVILCTSLSYAFNFEEIANVEIVGDIPVGLPEPQVPLFELIPKVLPVAVSCTVVSYAIHMSLSKMFAQKHGYKVDGTQELFAFGISNIFGSFFSSLPMSTSLSRSLVQDNSGCKSLFTTGVSGFILLWVFLYLAPLFECLPTAALASIIVVSLKGMFLQTQDLVTFGKMSTFDGFIWILTFLITAFIDVGIGLMTGVAFSLVYLLYQASVPQISVIEPAKGTTDIFISPNEYQVHSQSQTQHHFVKIAGNLNFSNAESTQDSIMELVSTTQKEDIIPVKKTVILDISGVNSMDPSACKGIAKLYKMLEIIFWKTSFVGVNSKI